MHENASHNLPLADPSAWADPSIRVGDGGIPLSFTIQDAFNYHGYDAPGGVALGFRLLQRAFALLAPDEDCPDRYGLSLLTSFPGLGLRDVMELVTRMVTGGRYVLDPSAGDERAQEGVEGRFYYRFAYGGRSVELAPAAGCPGPEFIRLGRASKRPGFTASEAGAWKAAKFALADILLRADANAVIRVL
jgi:hypothetical protein